MDRGVLPARPGGRSRATTRTISGLPTCPPGLGCRPVHRAHAHLQTLYVLVFIAHDRRELVHVNVTANPTAAWVWRQLIEATPWGSKPRHLPRDRDAAYGRDFRQRAGRIGI